MWLHWDRAPWGIQSASGAAFSGVASEQHPVDYHPALCPQTHTSLCVSLKKCVTEKKQSTATPTAHAQRGEDGLREAGGKQLWTAERTVNQQRTDASNVAAVDTCRRGVSGARSPVFFTELWWSRTRDWIRYNSDVIHRVFSHSLPGKQLDL